MSTGTGTALAQITEPAHRAVAGLGAGGVNAIVPQTFDDVFRFSQVLARSGLCPHGMDTAEKVSVAILTGLEIGVKPMQAVQGIAVIGGRPCIWGDLALGIVRGANTLEYIKETFEGDEAACDWSAAKPSGAMLQFKAVCRVKRKGEPEVVTEFSVGDAVVAKLWGKRGYNSKDTPWITNPKRMLKMRARGFGLRDTHADVLKGLYIAEEMIGVEEDRPQIAGPAAPPPPPPPAIESRQQEAAPPANTNAGHAAPPAETVEEAEIVETPSPQPERGAGGMNLPQEETELLVEAGVLKSEETQHPPLAQEEAFDPEAWLAEVKDRFDEARTPDDVDGVHEVFGCTANDSLGLTDRQKYQDMHEAAVLRTAAEGKPKQAEQTGEPGPAPDEAEGQDQAEDDEDDIPSAEQPAAQTAPDPGEAYYRRITDAVADSARTYDSVAGLWKATKPERDALIADGSLSRERMKEMQASIKERYAKEYGDPAPQAPAAAPARSGPTAPPAEESDLAKMDREFRAQVAACSTMEEVGNLVANTMVARNAFSGTPEHKAWTALVAQRRKQISGVA